MFDIDTTGSKGEVLVEIKEKNGSSIKTVTWVPKVDKTKSNAVKEHKEEPTFLEFVQNKASDAFLNLRNLRNLRLNLLGSSLTAAR